MSNKEIVNETIRHRPELVSSREIPEEIAILAAIQKGKRDVEAGRIMSRNAMEKRLESWISGSN
jgi:predicted transcriptional regulator